MGRLALDLSGTPCLLDFDGFHRPLGVFAGNIALSLSPWTYRRHMEALRTISPAGSNPSPCGGRPVATTPCPPYPRKASGSTSVRPGAPACTHGANASASSPCPRPSAVRAMTPGSTR